MKDLTGHRFGDLVVLHHIKEPKLKWVCICDCGRTTTVFSYALIHGKTKSCGCYNSRCRMKHGMSKLEGHPHGTRAYRAWETMKSRCYRPNNASYSRYGGRGITVCDVWARSFIKFVEDMGEPLPGQQLDRINNSGNYAPGNCRWVYPKENGRNRSSNKRLSFGGETKCLSEWAEEYAIPYNTLFSRLSNGWSFERAITTPRIKR